MSVSLAALLRRAVDGDHEAIMDMLELYRPLIDHHSRVYGHIDEDCRQYIIMQMIIYIAKFKI